MKGERWKADAALTGSRGGRGGSISSVRAETNRVNDRNEWNFLSGDDGSSSVTVFISSLSE